MLVMLVSLGVVGTDEVSHCQRIMSGATNTESRNVGVLIGFETHDDGNSVV